MGWVTEVRFLAGAGKGFFPFTTAFRPGVWPHPPYFIKFIGCYFLLGIAAGAWSWPIPPSSIEFKNSLSCIYIPYIFMEWCLVKHRDTLYLPYRNFNMGTETRQRVWKRKPGLQSLKWDSYAVRRSRLSDGLQVKWRCNERSKNRIYTLGKISNNNNNNWIQHVDRIPRLPINMLQITGTKGWRTTFEESSRRQPGTGQQWPNSSNSRRWSRSHCLDCKTACGVICSRFIVPETRKAHRAENSKCFQSCWRVT